MKEQNKKIRRLEKQVADAEERISRLEEAISELEARMATPEGAADLKLYERHQQLKQEVAGQEEAWEAALTELEELKK